MNMIVVGASSLGKCVIHIAKDQAAFKLIGVVDDALERGIVVEGLPCLGRMSNLLTLRSDCAFGVTIAIGEPSARKSIFTCLQRFRPEIPLLTVVHPRATILGKAKLGPGCIIFPGCVISPGAVIGKATVLNANVSVGSAAQIGGFSTLCPGANIGSEAIVGAGVYIGMGAAVAQRVHLGAGSTLGALSFARNNIPDKATAVGAPARISGAS